MRFTNFMKLTTLLLLLCLATQAQAEPFAGNIRVEPDFTSAVVTWTVREDVTVSMLRYYDPVLKWVTLETGYTHEGTTWSITLTNLQMSTEYDVQVMGMNEYGTASTDLQGIEWTESTTFKTKTPLNNPPIITGSELGPYHNSYKVYWTADPLVDLCEVRYIKDAEDAQWIYPRSITHDGTNWCALLEMLYPGATYTFYVKGWNTSEDVSTDLLEPFTFTMPGVAEPTNLKVVPSLTSAVVSWNVNPGAISCVIQYREISETETYWHEAEAVFYDEDKYGCTLTGLKSRTDYEVKVLATYYDGDESDWVSTTFTTPALGVPANIGGELGVEQNSYKVTWTADPLVDVCYVRYRKAPYTEWIDVRSENISNDGTNWWAGFYMLYPGATYEVIAQARAVGASDAYSDWTEPYTFTMPGVAEPTNLKVVPDLTSAQVTWKTNPGAMSCKIQYREISETVWTDATCSWDNGWYSCTLDGLTSRTDYEVQVRAFYYDGDASEWVTATFATLPLLNLANDATDNSVIIIANAHKDFDVTLKGRTIYKDGNWNTLCLPFDVKLAGSPLAGATAKTLTDATMTGTTVRLTFGDAVDVLQANVPYIIKWEAGGENIVNPTFPNVTIVNAYVEDRTVSLADGNVKFVGYYDAFDITAEDDNIYYMGSGNTLKYTATDRTLKAFRAYFKFTENAGGGGTRQFILDFGDGDTSTMAVKTVSDNSQESTEWYTVDGMKLDKQPTRKGLYINGGKKLVIK